MHILLAEDDKTSRELLRRILEAETHTVELAVDGEDAWRLLEASPRGFDACVLDICMPSVSGIDLLERMRANDAHKRTPVILCTALNDRATVQKAARLGVSHFVVKPYSRTVMRDKLEQIRALIEGAPLPEEPAIVCRRLGIDADTHREMIDSLLADAHECCEALRTVPAAPALEKLLIRLRGIKGSCLTLGMPQVAELFRALKELLDAHVGASETESYPEAKMSALLVELERDLAQIAARQKTPA
jgi:two-component system chemotaxis response regulator CheY